MCRHRPPTNSGVQDHRYRSVNRVALGFVLYCLALPLLLYHFRQYVPAPIRTCASLRVFGRPCPLCGLTRGLNALLQGNVRAAWSMTPLTFPVVLLAGLEVLYRGCALAVGFRQERLASIIRWDLRIHIGLAVCYFAYSGLFLLSWIL